MTTAQNILILGGLLNVFLSIVGAYGLYWVRLRDSERPTASGLTAHKVSLWNGFLLFSLAVAIEHTGFTPEINNLLAIFESIVCVLASLRTIMIWWRGIGKVFRQDGLLVRSIGLGHIVDLVVVAGILYGVARTVWEG